MSVGDYEYMLVEHPHDPRDYMALSVDATLAAEGWVRIYADVQLSHVAILFRRKKQPVFKEKPHE